LFARRRLPEMVEVREVRFSTFNPEVSSRCYWAKILLQIRPLGFSSIDLRYDPIKRQFSGKTVNVDRLSFDLTHMSPNDPINVELDGIKLYGLPWPSEGRLVVERTGGQWKVWRLNDVGVGSHPWGDRKRPWPEVDDGNAFVQFKGPHRNGTFKAAFNHRFLFLYGTAGTPEENAWALAKARYDAETFGYRGNGSVDVMPDSEFNADKTRDRSVILYGNSDSNRAWTQLLGNGPVQVSRGRIHIGDRELKGDDLACLFVRPRHDSDTACVAAVSGSGMAGLRLTERIPVFLSGVGIPDCVVLSPKSLTEGASGILAAGFFGNNWQVGADFAFR
jgi:hypothetical protein